MFNDKHVNDQINDIPKSTGSGGVNVIRDN